ncbi:MAG: YceI family protein [Acidimicrobiales bacterium]
MQTTTTERTAPVLPAGTWDIDPTHSMVEFSVRHLMVSKVKGRFGRFSGTITSGTKPLDAGVEATIDIDSIDTNDPQRDAHLRSPDFLDAERYPTAVFASRRIRQAGADYVVDGDLTLHGVTRPVELRLEFNGVGGDPYGGTRAGFSATIEISRREFGVDISIPLANGGVVVGDKITINLEIEAVARAAS